MKEASILVVGGGIAGLTAAIEAAEAGHRVYLVEKEPYLGGKVAQWHRYFPKLCSPYCGLEINFNRIRANRGLSVFTGAEVEQVTGQPGDFDVNVKLAPRFVELDSCTACGDCAKVCPVERLNEFNLRMDHTKAAYLPFAMAFPMKYAIDGSACLGPGCAKCVTACRYDAIDLTMRPKTISLKVGSIALATGWKPYDATRIDNLGFGRFANVITNVMLERLAAIDGPTRGKIVRPSDGKEIESVAFVQCAGSRDTNHLPYCSAVCCLASLKQAAYIREQYPNVRVYIFYIDIRTPGTYEDFYKRIRCDERVSLIKGKVASVEEESRTQDLIVEAEEILASVRTRTKVDLVVLATGMVPATYGLKIPGLPVKWDDLGFMIDGQAAGVYAAGVVKRPMDVVSSVRDGTGASLRASQYVMRS